MKLVHSMQSRRYNMSNAMIIDGMRVPFTDEKNILAVIRNAGIDLPTFCYHSELSIYGA